MVKYKWLSKYGSIYTKIIEENEDIVDINNLLESFYKINCLKEGLLNF